MRAKVLIVLEALLLGLPVKLRIIDVKRTCKLLDTEQGLQLFMEGEKYIGNNPEPEKIWLSLAELSIGWLIKACETITDEELFRLTSNIGLNKIKQSQAKDRSRLDEHQT